MRRVFISLCLLSLLVLLSGCKSGEADELIYWAKLWAMVHDITDADGNPDLGAVTRFTAGEAFGLGTTGDDEGDAAIDAARLVDKIRKAEDEAKQAREAMYAGRSTAIDVLPHYNKAVDLRPDDWSYRNERGLAYLVGDPGLNDADRRSKDDFDKASALAKKSSRPDEYQRMLKHRAQAMETHVGRNHADGAAVELAVYLEESRTYSELYRLTKDNRYLLLKQQADTNRDGFGGPVP